ncbi:hypothetical protein GDO81_011973 [Engystomops pustulosus]|uniref:Uncharacterized protein n=1 Tax=Engystomops pustulosus TaxID=76066 RepID=A0AAV7BHW3_ENGPU|nr:hypothetical protein GDO81_011973 [Engystomops pustulosus]
MLKDILGGRGRGPHGIHTRGTEQGPHHVILSGGRGQGPHFRRHIPWSKGEGTFVCMSLKCALYSDRILTAELHRRRTGSLGVAAIL